MLQRFSVYPSNSPGNSGPAAISSKKQKETISIPFDRSLLVLEMMSSSLSGGSRTYGFDLDIVKSPATSTRASPASSSLTSTISESSNSPLSICIRKGRTLRKRPNQTYNEAAALLSAAYPNIFSATHLTNPKKSHKPHQAYSPDEFSELFLPFRVIGDESVLRIHHPSDEQKPPFFHMNPKPSPSCEQSCQTPDENEIQSKAAQLYNEYDEDFDAESMLDEEIEEGIIDSIMGEKSDGSVEAEKSDWESNVVKLGPFWSRTPMALLGLGGRLDICYGIRREGVSAWKDVAAQVNGWNFATVDVNEISPKLTPNLASTNNSRAEKKKKKKKAEKPQPATEAELERIKNAETSPAKEDSLPPLLLRVKKGGLMLKLDYNNVLDAWTGRGSPFPDDCPASGIAAGNDVSVRLAQMMDMIGEGEGIREASVQRCKEKIRYQVRKLNADYRPRMKGRFVRRPNSK